VRVLSPERAAMLAALRVAALRSGATRRPWARRHSHASPARAELATWAFTSKTCPLRLKALTR